MLKIWKNRKKEYTIYTDIKPLSTEPLTISLKPRELEMLHRQIKVAINKQ